MHQGQNEMSHRSLPISAGREVWLVWLFHHSTDDKRRLFFLSSRPASTSSSTSSSHAGSSHWPPEARTRRSSESASTSSSCPSASSSRRKTKASVPSHKHRCVYCTCVYMSQIPSASTIINVHLCVACWYLCTTLCLLSRGPPVNAVVIGEKLSVIEFHAARGSGVGIGISVAAFPFPLGGLHSRADAFTDFQQANQNKQDNPNYTPETDACVVYLCVFMHTCREIPAWFASSVWICDLLPSLLFLLPLFLIVFSLTVFYSHLPPLFPVTSL